MNKRIVIYRPSVFGKMYLCADGTTSNDRAQAAEYLESQFLSVVAKNWIVNTPESACAEFINLGIVP